MYRIILIILICLVIITSMTACWDAVEADAWAYVYSIGVDKGVSDKIRFTVQLPTLKGKPSGGGGGGGGNSSQQQGDLISISVDCPTLYAGVNMINTALSRTINYTHTKFMVVSEEIAKEGIEPFVNGMRRTRQIRRIMYFMVARGQASEFIENFKPVLGIALSKIQEGLMAQEGETGFFDSVSYGDVIDELKTTKGQVSCALAAVNDFSHYLPSGTKPKEKKPEGDYLAGEVPRKGGDATEFLGTALFDGDKMVGELNGDETRVMLMAKGDFKRASIVLPDPLEPESMVTLDVSPKKKPYVKVTFREGKPVINLKVFLDADLQNLQSDINYESEKLKSVLENSYKAYIKDKLDKTIEKCKGLNCDVFKFGAKASMQFLTIQEWEEYDWNTQFKNAEVTTEVELIIRRTGTVMKTNPTKSSKGEKK